MPNFKLLMAVFIAVQLATAGVGWWYHQHEQHTYQQQLQRLADQLIEHLRMQSDANAEILTLAQNLSELPQLALQIKDTDGSTAVAVGLVPEDALNLQVSLTDGRALLLSVAKSNFPWLWLLLAAVLTAVAGIGSKLLIRRQQRRYRPIWQALYDDTEHAETVPAGIQPLVTAITELVKQRHEGGNELQRLQQQLGQMEQTHAQHSHDMAQQLIGAQQRQLHLSNDVHCWQLLASQAEQMNDAALRQWLSLLMWRHQTEKNQQPVVQSLSHWFAKALREVQQSWPQHLLLLPDEDPAATRCQVVLDGDLLRYLMFSLLQALSPLVDGKEMQLSYRLESGTRDKLQLKFQYTGRSISARSRQILTQGPCAEPQWTDIAFELCYLLLQQLGADLQIQELADLGTRIICHVPVVGRDRQQTKRFQNLAIFDPSPGWLDTWRQSLQGVSEQVVATASVAELQQVLQSRLIDTVVVHVHGNNLNAADLQQLQLLSQRYQLIIFAGHSAKTGFAEMACVAQFDSPVLLADLQDLPLPGCQFTNQQLLIVDDNQTNLSFVRAMLEGQGINIDFAVTGQEALKLASNSRYQLILMDIQLPDLSGVEVTKRIRQLRHHQQTVILAFTGHALPEEAASFRLAGMDDVMIKPLDARKIAHILSRVRPVAETQ